MTQEKKLQKQPQTRETIVILSGGICRSGDTVHTRGLGQGRERWRTSREDAGGAVRLGALASQGQAWEASQLPLSGEAEAGDTRREKGSLEKG